MEKLIITAAICGAEVTKAHNPAVPYTIAEIGREAGLAAEAGAAIIHLHVREDDGAPTQCAARFAACIAEIRRVAPGVIIQPSTGGAVGMSNAERMQPLSLSPAPEMATLDCGTVNFGGDEIFVNTENTIKEFAAKMLDLGIKPEVEVFDKGMIDTAIRLAAAGFIKTPMHFNFVMGVNGGIAATTRDFAYLAASIPPGSTYTAAGIGRAAFHIAALAIVSGGHVRVGFEDNIYLSRGVLAKSNGELVAKAANLARELGREITTPAEARQILGL
ncbi:MAG: 3-keto-5-aminohexanoate cleavage protein [Defluviitaleaceae bacterium]|nr:3-keto-5-aminohexanoate cleavage protein [Defluviitaleaceae bacterium]